jgi:hypothetical protein
MCREKFVSLSCAPRFLRVSCFVLLGFSFSSALASPIQLLNWKPVPDAVGFPEINYTGLNLQTDVGAQSNGDGLAPVTNQTPGGLQSETIVNAPAPGSYPSSVFTGGTGYYDTTLTFFGLAPLGPAIQAPLPGGILQDSQVLGTGQFQITSTNVGTPVVLLSGNITNAVITGVDGGAAGAVINAHGVTYTGGIILGAPNFPAGATLTGNDMSISMTSVIPSFGVNGGTGQLNSFHADATGEFDINANDVVQPEPASLFLFVAASGLLIRNRRQRA